MLTAVGQEQFICQERLPGGSYRLREALPGGRSSGMHPTDFDQVELRRGVLVEMEHTTDPRLAAEIAMDHLAEDPDYYRKLATIHMDGAQLGLTAGGTQLVSLLASLPIISKSQAESWVGTMENTVQQSAEKKVKPLIIGAYAVGGVGVLLGLTALVVAMRRR